MTQEVTISIGSLANGNVFRALGADQLAALGDALSALLLARQVAAFAAEGHHLRGGTRWEERSPDYRRRIEAQGFTRVLTVTGRLRNSMRSSGGADEQGLVVDFFADAPYARFHQQGTKDAPIRPVFEITSQDRQFIADIAEQFIATLLRGEG